MGVGQRELVQLRCRHTEVRGFVHDLEVHGHDVVRLDEDPVERQRLDAPIAERVVG